MNHQTVTEHYNKGLQYAKSRKWDEAMEFLGKAIAENPRHVNSHNVLGKVHIQKGEVNSARKCWQRVLRIDPDNITAMQCLAEAGKGFGQIQFRRLLWPAVVVISIAALVITNYVLLRRIGDLEIKLAKATADQLAGDTPALLDSTTQEIRQDESVRMSEETSTHRQAKVLLQLETDSQVTAAYDQALADCRSGHYSQAIEVFRQILMYSGSHDLKDNTQYWLAECYYAQREYARALEEFQEVKRLFPKANKVFDAELKVAYSYYHLGQIQEVQQQLMQLSKDWPQQQYRSRIAFLSKVIQSGQTD
jgi:TolA-binding protein